MNRFSLIAISLSWFSITTSAQDLSTHRWKNRLVLLVADSRDNPSLLQQEEILEVKSDEVKERKLLTYTLLPDSVRLEKKEWVNKKLYKAYKRSTSGFEFILIGLDGGIKLRRNKPITTTELFRIIDSMPMRAAEIRRNHKHP